ncbi:MAG: ABC transporter ATP-binding protein [Sphaerochaetaceae bacterium]|nr:ABC transporter ATP-binding protein [Sphaerochaetaceae bacterium]
MKNKLEIREITKRFGDSEVLENVSFDVADGEFLSVLGPSGCGKTTLLRILIGLLKPDSGRIFKDDTDITDYKCDSRGMGIVFQNYALFENMTALQNVEYALKFHGKSKSEARETAMNMLSAVDLAEHSGKKPKYLSGGQQQRVAIARTLVLNPDIVLFDEPMSALDIAARLAMRKELKNLQKRFGTTMIYVTHDQEEAFSMSDRIMILDKGNISQIDTPENICRYPADNYVKTFVLDNLQAKIDSLSRFTSIGCNGKV